MKNLLHILICILPWRLKRFLLAKCFGFKIHRTAYIGLSVLNVADLEMAPGSTIGHLNFIRSIARLDLGASASIGNLNWITGAVSYLPKKNPPKKSNPGSLLIGEHSAITNRHYIDCSGGVKIDRFSILAGVRTTLLTHSVDLQASRQNIDGVMVGSYCFVGTSCVLLPGSNLPDYSVLGAGSILTQYFEESHALYAGNPARGIKSLSKDALFFTREKGHVD
jgi:acetyltransferase-like isoleucine patch superfamily enzyme